MQERWKEISRLYHAALELPKSERTAFLEACVEDEDVRREVSSLLASRNKAEVLLEADALKLASHMIEKESPSLLNLELGSYRITSLIGRGGMGEVYQASDKNLGRSVAIKVLPKLFAKDPELVSRLRREAQILASLSHPNIAAVYGLEKFQEIHCIVMELVTGETLAAQLAQGPVPIKKTLNICHQLAEALEAAHEKGIVHRDLKPSNIKVSPEGKVKVLDFGLAKAFAVGEEVKDLSKLLTVSIVTTEKGRILGTPSYMSPEQAKGKDVDKRTDIWAFGCILYECLTGKRVFEGETVTETLSAVLRDEPDWRALPKAIPPAIRLILRRCLERELKDRYRDIGDVLIEIRQVLADPNGILIQPVIGEEPKPRLRQMLPWIAATLILTAIIAGAIVWNLRKPEPPQVVRLEHILPEDQQLSGILSLAVSPDGKQFVYSTTNGLYLRSFEDLTAKLIPGTEENPQQPFFSPDGQWIGYFSSDERQLKKIAIDGGIPVALCDNVPQLLGASWGANDTILYGQLPYGIMRISANGGTPEPLFERGDTPIAVPQLLPDLKHVLINIGANSERKIAVLSLESGELTELFPGTDARYISSGHLVYVKGDEILAVSFNPENLEVAGAHIGLIQGVFENQYAISDSGTLVYLPGAYAEVRTFVWVDREGKEEAVSAQPDNYYYPRISPDGTQLAYVVREDQRDIICFWDLASESLRQLTIDNAHNTTPFWTPDGERITFGSDHDGNFGAFWKKADGSGVVEPLVSMPDRRIFPFSWSPDGKTLLLLEFYMNNLQLDIGMISMEGDRTLKPLLHDEYREGQPKISPNGRWIVYTVSEEAQNVIYVSPFPEVNNGKWPVSINGGDSPLWSRDGRELFYRSGDLIMAVGVETMATFKAEKAEILFRGKYVGAGIVEVHPWDIHPDGKRFLMMKPSQIPSKINVIVNWVEELKDRVPVD